VVTNPDDGSANQFFGHGYGVSLGWPGAGTKALTVIGGILLIPLVVGIPLVVFGAAGATKVTNDDLLGDPTSPAVFSYHSLRYDGGKQRIPTASDYPMLSKNRVDPSVDHASF
jgi:hypothetical protein